jgi:hypothetical protein
VVYPPEGPRPPPPEQTAAEARQQRAARIRGELPSRSLEGPLSTPESRKSSRDNNNSYPDEV